MIDYSVLISKAKEALIGEAEAEYYKDKCVLVTGGGGSVGSALVRRLAALDVSKIVIFDIYENCAFELFLELSEMHKGRPEIVVEIGSVRDRDRVCALFLKHRPHIVFHAAAHKHVSLMEDCPFEAIKNNCIGTLVCAEAAEMAGAEKFVLVSSDKAVRPAGVMGASKRICEKILLSRSTAVTYCAVRFGNIFGSAGSVVPIFERQIEDGVSLTVTDKRATRYFIHIEDAAELLICAGAIAAQGELFVLDMGKPYNIYELAKGMLEISGKELEIIETGLRPGEKLYEEYLICDADKYDKTKNERIFVEREEKLSDTELSEMTEKLMHAFGDKSYETDKERTHSLIRELLPEFLE